jgi:hypothetical protein
MITEDTGLYLADFGVSVVAGAASGLGILDMPSELIVDGQVISTEYTLTCESAKFGDLLYGSKLTVNGAAYTVRANVLISDGVFTQLSLQRDLETTHTTSTTPLSANGAAASIDDLGLDQLDPLISGGTASTTYIDGNDISGGTA